MPMQPAVAGVDEGVEVDGDDGDEVTPDDLAQGLMIRRTRRRSSKKVTKNSNSSVKTMCAQGAH